MILMCFYRLVIAFRVNSICEYVEAEFDGLPKTCVQKNYILIHVIDCSIIDRLLCCRREVRCVAGRETQQVIRTLPWEVSQLMVYSDVIKTIRTIWHKLCRGISSFVMVIELIEYGYLVAAGPNAYASNSLFISFIRKKFKVRLSNYYVHYDAFPSPITTKW